MDLDLFVILFTSISASYSPKNSFGSTLQMVNNELKQCAQVPVISIVLHVYNTILPIYASLFSGKWEQSILILIYNICLVILMLNFSKKSKPFALNIRTSRLSCLFLFDDLLPFEGDANMHDLEDNKNDDIVIDEKELKKKRRIEKGCLGKRFFNTLTCLLRKRQENFKCV
jgi:hypothetical protein